VATTGDISGTLLIGDWRVDPTSGALQRGDEAARIEPRVMAVLLDLAAHPGVVRSKDDLIAAVWGDTYVGEAALSRCVSELRRTLGDDARDPRYIETLPKRGYRLVAAVSTIAPEAAAVLPENELAAPLPTLRPHWQTLLAAAIVLTLFVGWWRTIPPAAEAPIERIAVLPLRALSDDPQQRFFAEGLTEELIANLATLDAVRVVSGRAARLARDADASAAAIAASLGVDAVVDGTVQRSGDRTLVSLELVQASNERLLWAGTYQERGAELIAVQREVAAQAAREIGLALATIRGVPRARPENPDARRELDRGRMLAARSNPVDALRSLDHFRRALEIDTGYALAWALLADVQATLAWNNWSVPAVAYAEARNAAHTALDLDPALPEAYAVLAAVAAERNHDWPEADRGFRTAVELGPPSAFALERFGRYQRRRGRYTEAAASTGAALALAPESIPISISHAWSLILTDDLAAAQPLLETALAFHDDLADAYEALCAIANLQEQYTRARARCARAAATPGHELALGARAYAEARAGDMLAARATLRDLERLEPTAAALALATAHMGLGQEAEAIAILQEAARRRAMWLPALLENPYLRPLSETAEVRDLLDELLVNGRDDD
jgi:TolB-like protein/DNA-binding winged helix-turn-helix (wHTH) protein/Tfp pilus assembly protein PilF